MSMVERTIKAIRPKLRDVAPQSYWITVLFAAFNIIAGVLMYNGSILYTVKLITVIPIRLWAIAFLTLGLLMLYSIIRNNWKLTQTMHTAGIIVKSYWICELLGSWLLGSSPFALIVWALVLGIQVIVLKYFGAETKFPDVLREKSRE